MSVPFPPPPAAIISYMLDRRLDFDPGTQFAYSNLGFLVLGRVIEQVSGEPYDVFVNSRILAPLRIQRMRLGKTPVSLRAPGEVTYYDYPGAPLVDSLMPGVSGKVSEPYSGIVAMESIDSAGGWIASPIDLVRIFAMLDGWRTPSILTPQSVQQMVTPVFTIPGVGLDAGKSFYVGLGIGMARDPARHGHTMAEPLAHGLSASRPAQGCAWAVTFNSAPHDALYSPTASADFDTLLQRIFTADALQSALWPDGDLFPQYFPAHRSAEPPGRRPAQYSPSGSPRD